MEVLRGYTDAWHALMLGTHTPPRHVSSHGDAGLQCGRAIVGPMRVQVGGQPAHLNTRACTCTHGRHAAAVVVRRCPAGGAPIIDSTTTYLREHVSPAIPNATLLVGTASVLKEQLTRRIGSGLPLLSLVSKQLYDECPEDLRDHLDMQQVRGTPAVVPSGGGLGPHCGQGTRAHSQLPTCCTARTAAGRARARCLLTAARQ